MFVIACILIIFLILLILFYKRFFLSTDIHKDTRVYPLVLEFYESMDEPCYKARNNTCVKVTKKEDEYTQHVIDTKKLKLLKNYECKSNYCYYFDKNYLSGIIDDSRFFDVYKYNKEIRFGNTYYLKETILGDKTLYYAVDWPPRHVVLNDKLEVLSAGERNLYFSIYEEMFATELDGINEPQEIRIYNAKGELQRVIESDIAKGIIDNYYITLEGKEVVLYNYNGEKLIVLCELKENFDLFYWLDTGTIDCFSNHTYLYFSVTDLEYVYSNNGGYEDTHHIYYEYDRLNNKVREVTEDYYEKQRQFFQ